MDVNDKKMSGYRFFAFFYRFCILSLLLPFAACSPVRFSMNDYSQLSALPETEFTAINGAGFTHLVLPNRALLAQSPGKVKSDFLRVYIEGDGNPYLPGGEYPAADPTPRNLPTLELMMLDPKPAIYLGRPCYFVYSSACEKAKWWTNARYSKEVVHSMSIALDLAKEKYAAKSIELVGYSGGGVLAVLLANNRADVKKLVTIAANLDVGAWTRLHAYQPLDQSLNPAVMPLQITAGQLHLFGELDENVPASVARAYIEKHDGQVRVEKGQNHVCCWAQAWPAILSGLDEN